MKDKARALMKAKNRAKMKAENRDTVNPESLRDPHLVRWHYTVRPHLERILRDGFLKAATAHVPKGERPAVWFSTNQVWEETANKMADNHRGTVIGLDRNGTHLHFGLVRIGVKIETAPYHWGAFQAKSRASEKTIIRLAKAAAISGANPRDWWVSFEPVRADKWIAIEVWDGASWTAFDLANWMADNMPTPRAREADAIRSEYL